MARRRSLAVARAVAVLSAMAFVAGCAAGSFGKVPAGRRAADPRGALLGLELVPDRPRYTRDAPLSIRYVLTNRGRSAVYVNKRCMTNPLTTPEQAREIVLEVVGPDGAPVACDTAHRTGLPKTDDYVWLKPRQAAASEEVDLRQFCQFASPGIYRVSAVYHNVMGQELGLPVFQGTVRSEPVSVTIVE